MRLFITLWAIVAVLINPVPTQPDETLRPYLGEPQLIAGPSSLLLGPWQRFDTQHYLRIARQGYAAEEDSVFPPLYPALIRGVTAVLGGSPTARLTAALLISNLACLALLILLHKFVASEIGPQYATRTLVYALIFPTAFYWFAGYTESLFLLFTLGAFWASLRQKWALAGVLGFCASLTRLTGWVLIVPFAYLWWQKEGVRFKLHLLALAGPPLGLIAFLLYRWQLGLPPLGQIYRHYWYQQTGIPGRDLLTAVQTLFFHGPARAGEITLYLDLAVAILLLVATYYTFKRLGPAYGLYSGAMLFFILLPTSELKPLYSFTRYTLAFFPLFIGMGVLGEKPMWNRLFVYGSILLYLYLSGQFFVWGWVA